MDIILKLKKVFQSVNNMHKSIDLQDSFDIIINETCRVLDCERASVFLVDPKSNELWTKVAKGTTTIRMPIGTGIAGFVLREKQPLNILDAYKDDRFNPEFDRKNNFKTRTILCSPILDSNNPDQPTGTQSSTPAFSTPKNTLLHQTDFSLSSFCVYP